MEGGFCEECKEERREENNVEETLKNVKNEIKYNISELEEFFSKKYEYLFRIVNFKTNNVGISQSSN